MRFVKTYSIYLHSVENSTSALRQGEIDISSSSFMLGDSLGISVTDEILERASRVKRLIWRPQEALLCVKAKRQRQMFYRAKAKRQQQQKFSVAKAKRQLQSARSERKSITRFGDEP